MVGDRIFVVDLVRSARLQASVSSAPVYFYRFSYRGRHSLSEDFSGKDIDLGNHFLLFSKNYYEIYKTLIFYYHLKYSLFDIDNR